MVEFSQGPMLTQLDLAFGFLEERPFRWWEHIVRIDSGIDQPSRLDYGRGRFLRHAFSLSNLPEIILGLAAPLVAIEHVRGDGAENRPGGRAAT
jgi:hypothetical protein